MTKLLKYTSVWILISVMFASCSKKEEEVPVPTTGNVTGKVVAAEGLAPLEGVQVSAFDADTNEPAGASVKTGADGGFSIELDPGTYYLRLAKLGYKEVPPPGVVAIPFTITVGESTVLDFELLASAVVDGGAISGQVTLNGAGVASVLVIATDTLSSASYSSVTDAAGNYTIYNIPAGGYTVKGWLSGHNSEVAHANVAAKSTTTDIAIALTAGATATLDGSVKFLATGNKEVDVALIHPGTLQAIPGLTIATMGIFTLTDIPDGEYLARASYNNDTLVVDPDFIVKFGDPVVVVSGGVASVKSGLTISATLDFAVTNAITLISPTNFPSEIVPLEVADTSTLVFSWTPYASTSDYVVELSDLNGNVIWGGFTVTGGVPTKNMSTIQTSYTYDGPALTAGKIYRWKVYASKDQRATGTWSLISMSEDQMGLIKIVQ